MKFLHTRTVTVLLLVFCSVRLYFYYCISTVHLLTVSTKCNSVTVTESFWSVSELLQVQSLFLKIQSLFPAWTVAVYTAIHTHDVTWAHVSCICVHARTHTHTHTCTHIQALHVRVCTHARLQTYMHALPHAHKYVTYKYITAHTQYKCLKDNALPWYFLRVIVWKLWDCREGKHLKGGWQHDIVFVTLTLVTLLQALWVWEGQHLKDV